MTHDGNGRCDGPGGGTGASPKGAAQAAPSQPAFQQSTDAAKPFAILMDATQRVLTELQRTRNEQSRRNAIRFTIQHLRDERRRAWEAHANG